MKINDTDTDDGDESTGNSNNRNTENVLVGKKLYSRTQLTTEIEITSW
jgi:hypothetical protein